MVFEGSVPSDDTISDILIHKERIRCCPLDHCEKGNRTRRHVIDHVLAHHLLIVIKCTRWYVYFGSIDVYAHFIMSVGRPLSASKIGPLMSRGTISGKSFRVINGMHIHTVSTLSNIKIAEAHSQHYLTVIAISRIFILGHRT